MTTPAEYQRRFNTPAADLTAEFQRALDSHRAKAANIQAAYISRAQQTASRTELTQQAKAGATARDRQQERARLTELREAENKLIADAEKAALRRFAGHQGAASDQTTQSRRQAAEMAARIEDSRDALDKLHQADLGQDEHYAQAIAVRAREYGWNDVVTAYTADRPKAAAALEALAALPNTQNPQWRFHQMATYDVPAVGAIAHMDDMQIARAARQAETDAA